MEKPEKAPLPIYRRRETLYIAIAAILVAFLLLSSRLTGRPPVIDSITPKIGSPQDVMVITGRFFGSGRNSAEVVIGGYAPVSSDYLEWTESRISLRIPGDASSGMVRVVTKNGRSNAVLFTNRQQIPVVLSGPGKPGQPYIAAVEPASGAVGTLLTVSGMNFGLQRGGSRVYFTWLSGDPGRQYAEAEPSSLTPALEYDLDYETWGDREVQVRIPDGASSGHLVVVTDKGQSNAVYVEVEGQAGTKLFQEKRTYSVQYALQVGSVSAKGPNRLYLWVPLLAQAPEQREIQLVSEEPRPLFEDVGGVKLFMLENLEEGRSYSVYQSFMVDRYSVQTKINVGSVPAGYDGVPRLFKRYTAADSVVPAAEGSLVKLSRSIVGAERNPYRKARAVYNYLLQRLEPDPALRERDVLKALEQRKGDAYVYAVLFCALCRSAGVPARPVAGYLVAANPLDASAATARHYWAEFYLQTVGWVPADPFLGEGKQQVDLPPEVNRGTYYFGNLDYEHLTFSKGLIELRQMDPQGATVRRPEIPSLQSFHEEAAGELSGFSVYWSDLQVLGAF
jgi:hypothetical protein